MTEEKKEAENYDNWSLKKSITLFTAWSRSSDFEGRSSRKEFWLACASGLLVMTGFVIIGGILTAISPVLTYAFAIPIAIIFATISLALCVRRLHDIGYGGISSFLLFLTAPFVVFFVVPLGLFMPFMGIGIIMGGADFADIFNAADTDLLRFSSLLYAIFHFVVFLWLGIAKSEEGANNYGPNPKDIYK